tara:strand:- start:776 stop:2923 length:2148 start_codon:yes stop_codon:yes gene_type:complete
MKENTIFKAIAVLILLGILALGCVSLYSGFQDLSASENEVEIEIEIDDLDAGDTDSDSGSDNTCPYLAEIPAIESGEGGTIMVEVGAIDIDSNNITYTFDGVSGADINDNQFTWITEEGDAGDYTVTVTADDGQCEVTTTFDITINEDESSDDDDDEDNTVPQLTASDVTVTEGDLVTTTVLIVDVDGDDVTVTFSSPLDSNGEWQTVAGDAGVYTATITADDGTDTNSVTITITVLDDGTTNTNTAPEVSASDVSVTEGDLVTVVPTTSDADGDNVTLSYTSPLDANGEWQTVTGDAGVYTATITANDGTDSTSVDITITVLDVNAPNYDLTITNTEFLQLDQNGFATVGFTFENWGTEDITDSYETEVTFSSLGLYETQTQTVSGMNAGDFGYLLFTFDASPLTDAFNDGSLTEATLTFDITVDSQNVITETNEANNEATHSVTLQAGSYTEPTETEPAVDLAVTNLELFSTDPANAQAQFSITVENLGTEDITDSFYLIGYMYMDMNLEDMCSINIQGMQSGYVQTHMCLVSFEELRNLESAEIDFAVMADSTSVIDEDDETNNDEQYADTWNAYEMFEADLVIDSIEIYDLSLWDAEVTFEINATNTGYMDLEDAYVVTEFAATDGSFTVRDDFTMTNLTAGNTVTYYRTVDFSSLVTMTSYFQLVSESYGFEVRVDPLSEINEFDETNNTSIFEGILQNPIAVLNMAYQF